ncbi:MAG: hypothetical protein K2N64_07475 [Anaeroplasmataceae bacterium]|nr:hypothetical protein [Anaeroplasmataceae bacterium]
MKTKGLILPISIILFCLMILSFIFIFPHFLFGCSQKENLISYEEAVAEYEKYIPTFCDETYDGKIHIGEDFYYSYINEKDDVEIHFYKNEELLNSTLVSGSFPSLQEHNPYVKHMFLYENHFIFMIDNVIYLYNTEGTLEKKYINPYTEGEVYFYIGKEVFVCNSYEDKTKVYRLEFGEELRTVDSLPEILFTIMGGITFLSIYYSNYKYLYLIDAYDNCYYQNEIRTNYDVIMFEDPNERYFFYDSAELLPEIYYDVNEGLGFWLWVSNPMNEVKVKDLNEHIYVKQFPYEKNCLFLLYSNHGYALAFYEHEAQKFKFSEWYNEAIDTSTLIHFSNQVYFSAGAVQKCIIIQ